MSETTVRERLLAALAKPAPQTLDDIRYSNMGERFHPWEDVIHGIDGTYSSACDDLMIKALEAVRDNSHHDLCRDYGLAGQVALFILSGHDLTSYGTWPLSGWPNEDIADLWQPLIDRWKAYRRAKWKVD